jgi:hypothetical protein
LRGRIDKSRNSQTVGEANDSRMTKYDLSFFIIIIRADSLDMTNQ